MRSNTRPEMHICAGVEFVEPAPARRYQADGKPMHRRRIRIPLCGSFRSGAAVEPELTHAITNLNQRITQQRVVDKREERTEGSP